MFTKRKKNTDPPPSDFTSTRPFIVTLLIVEVLLLTGLNGFRCLEAFRYWVFLTSISMSVSPAYLAVSGLLWTLIGSALILILWRGQPNAPHLLRIFAVIYGLYYWVDRWLLTVLNLNERWPFALLMTTLGIFFPLIVLSRPKVSTFYSRRVQ